MAGRSLYTLAADIGPAVHARQIGLFHYLIIHDNKWCPGGYREYVTGGGHLNPCPGGLEGIIEACPGGSGTT